MSKFVKEVLSWLPPVSVAIALTKDERNFVFLYSGQQLGYTGRYSYLAIYPQETISGSRFENLKIIADGTDKFENSWFGYLGYELLHDTETIPQQKNGYISLPDLWFSRFGLIIIFDHHDKTVSSYRLPEITLEKYHNIIITGEQYTGSLPPPAIYDITSPMSYGRYIDTVVKTKEAIANGDFYQANITRKFIGTFAEEPNLFTIFVRLIEASPSAYSAFILIDNTAIISSSPECFLKIDSNGHMESRPIKGTSPRFEDQTLDRISYQNLVLSEKDRAENLMIVDLMRNDFARSCKPGSVNVERLFEVSSYATLHHMASTITGQKLSNVSTIEAVKNCFPPGSMTGTPKISAIKWCAEHENIRRGVYSGALGWFGSDGSCDLSVVIRTLIIEGNKFEFQVGGAITSGSEPEKEWQETITKSRGIAAALGINSQILENI